MLLVLEPADAGGEKPEDPSSEPPAARAEEDIAAAEAAGTSAEAAPDAATETAAAPDAAPPPGDFLAPHRARRRRYAGWGTGDPRAPESLRRPHRRPRSFRASPAGARPRITPPRRCAALRASSARDLSEVTGTGRKGRILEEDVRRHVKERLAPPAPAAVPGPAAAAAGGPAAIGLPPLPAIDFSRFGDIEEVPLSRIKRRTAANLSRAWLTIPLVTHFDETDVTDLEAFRRSLRDDPDARGARITLLAFAMKALVATLKEFPTFNASLAPDGGSLIVKRYYHLGIAVDTPEGLVVPVVRDVDRKRVTDLSFELAEVSERARARKLRPDDVQGSCMTISSLGGIGGTGFTPIVNPPEVAILGLARTRVAPGLERSKEFAPRTILPVSLSYDHRVIDGAEAARFCRHLCLILADVRRLLL